MKFLLRTMFAAWLLLYSLCLSAQPELRGNSKFTIGIETGFNTATSCRACTYNELNKSRIPFALRGEHRIFRWLSVQLEVGHQNIRSSSALISGNTLILEGNYSIYLQSQLTNLMTTIGPRFQLRIGQGDLGAEYRIGVTMETLRQQLTIGAEEPLALHYGWATARVDAFRISYTYWATERLAIAIGLETMQTLNMGTLQFQGAPQASIPDSAVREALVLENGTYNTRQNFNQFQTITLGMHCRL